VLAPRQHDPTERSTIANLNLSREGISEACLLI
jgi:hypothetical protein